MQYNIVNLKVTKLRLLYIYFYQCKLILIFNLFFSFKNYLKNMLMPGVFIKKLRVIVTVTFEVDLREKYIIS